MRATLLVALSVLIMILQAKGQSMTEIDDYTYEEVFDGRRTFDRSVDYPA